MKKSKYDRASGWWIFPAVPETAKCVRCEWGEKVAEGRSWKWLSPPTSNIRECHGLPLFLASASKVIWVTIITTIQLDYYCLVGVGLTAWIWEVPEEQWQISREEDLHCLDLIQGGGVLPVHPKEGIYPLNKRWQRRDPRVKVWILY